MKNLFTYVVSAAALGLLLFAVNHVIRAHQGPGPTEPPVEPPRTPYGKTVAGVGVAEPRTENISIGSALSGVVLEVYVPADKVGQRVKPGDPLFRVDDRQLRAQLAAQKASLEAAKAQLARLVAMPRKEELPPSLAKVQAAKANLALQADPYERAHQLYPQRVVSGEEMAQRESTYHLAREQLEQAKAEHELLKAGAWEPDKDVARATVLQAEAAVTQTETEIERAVVRAPVASKVLRVNVRPGEYVSATSGQTLMTIGDLDVLHVRVDVDEADIPRFRPGAPARATLRGHPRQAFPMTFVRVEPFVIPKTSLTGANTERVDTRVLQVIYAVDAKDRPIYVGQQLDVFIDAGEGAP